MKRGDLPREPGSSGPAPPPSADPGGTSPPIHGRRTGLAGLLRPKGRLSRAARWGLATLAFLPILSVAFRSMAFPGVLDPGLGGVREIGSILNQLFSLSEVPSDQRDHALYLLFLPTSAMLVALARLTFGIRVLGFRSILISVGFHQSGIVPSLLLITVVVATIVLLRPWLRRIGLPYYARVSVILCVVAITMVGALLAGPWMRSDVVWGTAFFPVIVLGMLAEGIARTMDRDNIVTASWRAVTTIALAFVIALIGWVPAFRSLLLQFPELVLTQVVAIVLISEYLDLRLLQGWDKKVAETLMPKLVSKDGAFRVAVVRNRLEADVSGPEGRTARRRDALRSVQKIVDALRRGGYKVRVIEGDTSLLKHLRKFLATKQKAGSPRGIVLNLAHGLHGDDRSAQVPAMLEMSGIPYIGPTPSGHALALDRVAARALMQEAGIPIPASRVMAEPDGDPGSLRYPLAIYPRREANAKATLVREPRRLRSVLKRVIQKYGQEAVVEEWSAGRRVSAALLGNAPVRCLPLVELDPKTRTKICPAALDETLTKKVRRYAKRAYRACGCRDYARVDFLIGAAGDVRVVGVSTLGILSGSGSFARAGRQARLPFGRLIRRIVSVARARSLPGDSLRIVPPPPSVGAEPDHAGPGSASVVARRRPAADPPGPGQGADRESGSALVS